MSTTDEMEPPHLFLDPTRVTVSPQALVLVMEFAKLLPRNGKSWVVSFDWAFDRRYREKNSMIWHDLGPGIDMAAYEEREIPAHRIIVFNNIKIAFKIPEDVFNNLPNGRIDQDKKSPGKIIMT